MCVCLCVAGCVCGGGGWAGVGMCSWEPESGKETSQRLDSRRQ